MHAADALRLTEVLVATGICVASAEMFFVRDVLADTGFLSWRINRLARPALTRSLGQIGIDRLFSYPNVLALYGLRGLAAAGLIVSALFGSPTELPLLLVAGLTILLTIRGPQGNDGSDQMATLIIMSCALGALSGSMFSQEATLIFIAAISALAYATAGFLKAPVRGWRDGSYALDVLRTGSFGRAWLLVHFEHRAILPRLFGCGVAFGDSLIAIAVLLPPPLCAGLLAFGLVLHLGIAVVLGLNIFVWSFCATYPAVWWANGLLHR